MILFEEPAEYDFWLKLLFIIPAGLVIGAIYLAYTDQWDGFYALLGEAAFISLLFYFIMPRSYQIHHDRLKIVLGAPFCIYIPLSTIKELKPASSSRAFLYTGVKFATSSRQILEIVRTKGMNYIISPRHGDMFIVQLNQAIKSQDCTQH